MMRLILCILCLISFSAATRAQSDTLPLPLVEISSSPLSLLSESVDLQEHPITTMVPWHNATQLNQVAPWLHINQYSARGLASPNFRGLGYERTQINWNGLPINSPANGGLDYQLLSALAGDRWNFYSGGHGAIAGSGALGGVLHIAESFQKKVKALCALGINQFGDAHQRVQGHWQSNVYQGNIKLSATQGADRYHYKNEGQNHDRQNVSSLSFDVLQNNHWQQDRHQFSSHLWWNYSDRKIPANLFANYQNDQQKDHNLRLALNHQYIGDQGIFKNSIGALRENIYYTNDIIDSSPTVVYRIQYMGSYQSTWPSGWQQLTGVRIMHEHSYSYADDIRQFYTLAAHSNLEKQWAQHLLRMGVRQTIRLNGDRPLTGYIQYKWNSSRLSLSLKGSKDFRQPTLNDLFWQGPREQGNPDLKSESSWGQELLCRWWIYKNDKQSLEWRSNLYSVLVDNWIQWVTGVLPEGQWAPENIKKVWSRGIGNRLAYTIKMGQHRMNCHLSYEFNPVSEQKVPREERALMKEQLIYAPLHQGNVGLNYTYSIWNAYYMHRYVGARNLTTDGLSRARALNSATLGCGLKLMGKWQLSLQVDNLWNKYLEYFPGQPLPGTSILMDIQYSF